MYDLQVSRYLHNELNDKYLMLNMPYLLLKS